MKRIGWQISIFLVIVISGCYSHSITRKRAMQKQIVFRNGVYRNFPDEEINYTDKALRIFTGTLFSDRQVGSKKYDPDNKIREWYTETKPSPKSDSPCITWIGHATLLIQIADVNIITDPVYAEHLGLKFPYARVQSPGVDFKNLPKIDYILISHNHSDHLDPKTIINISKKQKTHAPIVLVPKGVKTFIEEKCGYSANKDKVHEFLWYKETKSSIGNVTFTFLPAYHTSGRNPLHILPPEKTIFTDPNHTAWGSWLIEHDDYKIYYAGDTGYQSHFKDIAQYVKKRFKTPDIHIALMPISPLEPADLMKKVKHIGPRKALQAFEELKADVFIPIHWGTFQLGQDTFMGAIELIKKSVAEGKKYSIVEKFEKPKKRKEVPYVKLFAIGEFQTFRK